MSNLRRTVEEHILPEIDMLPDTGDSFDPAVLRHNDRDRRLVAVAKLKSRPVPSAILLNGNSLSLRSSTVFTTEDSIRRCLAELDHSSKLDQFEFAIDYHCAINSRKPRHGIQCVTQAIFYILHLALKAC